MAETGSRLDPYPGFLFVVEFGSEGAGGFAECSGLDVEIETEDYAEGGENGFVHKLPGRRRWTDIILKRGIIGPQLWSWLAEQQLGSIKTRSVTLRVRQSGGEGELAIEVSGAFPVRWQGPQLDAGQSQVAMETLTLSHRGFAMPKRAGG